MNESAPGLGPVTAKDSRIIAFTLLGVLVVTLLLQIWRPYFYLTDDSLSGFLPVAVDMSRSLWSGRNIAINSHIFGGHYDMLHDPSCIALWSPWLFLFSPLGLTRNYALLVDAISFANSCTIAIAFAGSMLFLRRRLELVTSDWVIVVATISYTFTPFNLLIGSSWIGFLNAQTVYPIALAASFARRWWLGSLWIAPAFVFGLVGGHMHSTIMAVVFGGILVAALAMARKSWSPVLAFSSGGILALIAVSPLLWMAFQGFGDSDRSMGLLASRVATERVPLDRLVESLSFGPVAGIWSAGMPVFQSEPFFGLGLAFSLINFPALVAIVIAIRSEKFDRVSWAIFAVLLLSALWTIHPVWLATIHANIPLLKSLRWPFRELTVVLFALHVLFVFHAPRLWQLAAPVRIAVAAFGVGSLSLILFNSAPSLNVLPLDRYLIISGEADRYWASLSPRLPANGRIVICGNRTMIVLYRRFYPYSAFGAFNFASLFDVANVSGYSVTIPKDQMFYKVKPIFWSGIFDESAVPQMLETTPGLVVVNVRSVSPISWTVNTGSREWSFHYDEENSAIVEDSAVPKISREAVVPTFTDRK